MKEKLVPSAWLQKDGRRLDSAPYLSGAIEAKLRLEKLSAKKEPLHALTAGHDGGIYNGPQFVRNYVSDPRFGVPFLTSSSMLLADLSRADLLRKQDAVSRRLSYLRLEEGMTLISCSGTIGKMVYARQEMAGMWSSQDILKVVPDPQRIPSGYLFAFLSGRFGVPLVIRGTYGAIVQHIEPQHVSHLPVPRLGSDFEGRVHRLVTDAALARTGASRLLADAAAAFLKILDLPEPKPSFAYETPSVSLQPARSILERFDAYYYASWNCDARTAFDRVPADQRAVLGDVAEDVYIPGFFKRIYAPDPAFGYPYLTGGDVYELFPTSSRYLSKKVPEIERLILHRGMILIQDSGQLGGLIGRPLLVGRYLEGFACTNNMVRLIPRTESDQGYLFAALNNEYGMRLLMREATGSSIPHLEEKRIRRLEIPWPKATVREQIAAVVLEARELRDRACDLEREAVEAVCFAIEGGG